MANDRLWLRCRHCDEQTLLLKYYPGLHHVFPNEDGTQEEFTLNSYCWPAAGDEEFNAFAAFVEKHIECSPHNGGHCLRGDSVFIVVAESVEDDSKSAILDALDGAIKQT